MKNRIIITSIIAFVSFLFYSLDIFAPIDNKFYNLHFSSFTKKKVLTDSPIIILAIDDYSIEKMKIWPWPRSVYTNLLEILSKAGAKVVAFDINFDSYTSYNTIDDIAFGKAIKEANNVILAQQVQVRNKKVVFTDPIRELKDHADLAIVHPYLDRDYFIRRYHLVGKVEGKLYPYFAFQIVSKYLDIPISEDSLMSGERVVNFGRIKIPLDKHYKMLINYQGKEKTFPTIPISKVLESDFLAANPEIFKDKVILIGATAIYLQDLYPTPTAINMPGVEIHANAVHTLLSQNFLKTIPHLLYLVLILLPCFLISFLAWHLKAFKSLLALLGLSLFYLVLSVFAFKYNLVIHIVAPIFSLFISYLVIILFRFLNEEYEKREIRHVFNQYVSPSIVNEILTDKEKLKLGGDKRQISVFFSDIRSFTTFSESNTPEDVIKQLNEYLNAMTEVIFEYNGTLDKFVGDEIMAVWGTPLDQPDHAVLAVKCALRQLEVLSELQKKWASEGLPVLDIGVGINSGEAIAGNIGAEKYKDYTVIGDTVNLGARLEAYTRNVSDERGEICHFIISDATRKLVEDEVEVKDLGVINVKGKTISIKIWEVIGLKSVKS